MITGADLLCDALLAEGVDLCFANPGTSEMHFVAALDRKPQMRCVLGLFEGVVTGAADGYARMADRPAVTLLHTGPGLANGLANLHNARRARSPIVNIVGDHASYHLPFDAPLTTDIESFARPVSAFLHRIGGFTDIAPATAEACRLARSTPGTSTLILPANAAWSSGEMPPLRPSLREAPAAVDEDVVRNVARAIRNAPGRAALLLGNRAARTAALATAGRIATTRDVRLLGEVFIPRIESGAGRVPVTRIPYPVDQAVAMLQDIDVLVLVGAPAPVAFFAYPGKPSRLTRDDCQVLTLGRPGQDLPAALEALAEELGVPADAELPRVPAAPDEGLPTGPLTDAAITAVLARLIPEGAIVIDEALTSARGLFARLQAGPPHDYLMHTGGAIGIGIPLAVGAALGAPGRKVVALQADGSGMYTVQGLWTQAREGLDVLTIIYSNRAYGILEIEMRNVGVERFGRNAERMMRFDAPPLDWPALARSMGVEGLRADTAEDFARAVAGALSRPGPCLIEAVMAPG